MLQSEQPIVIQTINIVPFEWSYSVMCSMLVFIVSSLCSVTKIVGVQRQIIYYVLVVTLRFL